ncbi:Hypothetical protein A7982_02086 [Minicystis rosea]|nr:Hypothetical protein A7982_02086 [Minicystis rosea]
MSSRAAPRVDVLELRLWWREGLNVDSIFRCETKGIEFQADSDEAGLEGREMLDDDASSGCASATLEDAPPLSRLWLADYR